VENEHIIKKIAQNANFFILFAIYTEKEYNTREYYLYISLWTLRKSKNEQKSSEKNLLRPGRFSLKNEWKQVKKRQNLSEILLKKNSETQGMYSKQRKHLKRL